MAESSGRKRQRTENLQMKKATNTLRLGGAVNALTLMDHEDAYKMVDLIRAVLNSNIADEHTLPVGHADGRYYTHTGLHSQTNSLCSERHPGPDD